MSSDSGVAVSRPSVAIAHRSPRLSSHWARLPLVVRYGVAGGMTQVVYLSALWLALSSGLHYVAGICIAQVVAMAFAFPTYRTKVFQRGGSVLRQLAAFAGVWWTGAVLSLVGVPVLVEAFGMQPLKAQLLVLVVVVGSSFLAHRHVTFAGHVAVSSEPRP